MHQHTNEFAAQPGAVPPRIQLEDLVDAVSRGVMRALQAEDDVAGFTPTRKPPVGPVVIGIVLSPPDKTLPPPPGQQSGALGSFQVLG